MDMVRALENTSTAKAMDSISDYTSQFYTLLHLVLAVFLQGGQVMPKRLRSSCWLASRVEYLPLWCKLYSEIKVVNGAAFTITTCA